MASPVKNQGSPKRRPPVTNEDRENQIISLAVDLAEEQLANGTASAQVMVHFLRLGTMRARLEMEKLKNETALLQARTDALEAAQRIEGLYQEAMVAFSRYKGQSSNVDFEDSEDADE